MKIGVWDNPINYTHGLAWFDEDGEGMRFGEWDEVEDRTEPPSDPEEAEHWYAFQAAIKTPGCTFDRARYKLEWDSASAVNNAARAARAAVKSFRATLNGENPLPEWATTALANGWKPPKNWKP